MSAPRLLDLFCGAGGAGMGYSRVGFEVVGVDIAPQPRYPFEFHQADAMDVLAVLANGDVLHGTRYQWLEGIDVIHASPPCQDYSRQLRGLVNEDAYPRLIAGTLERLAASGLPWVVENVIGAPLPTQATLDGSYGVELCGTMFGLTLYRHRLFQTSFEVVAPRGCDHSILQPVTPYNKISRERFYERQGKRGGSAEAFREMMDVPWMSATGATEAIPPAYTEYLGRVMLGVMGTPAATAGGPGPTHAHASGNGHRRLTAEEAGRRFTGAADRRYNDWHYTLDSRCTMIDLDVVEYDHVTRMPIALMEVSANPEKATTVTRNLAELAGLPAYLVIVPRRPAPLDPQAMVSVRVIHWPPGLTIRKPYGGRMTLARWSAYVAHDLHGLEPGDVAGQAALFEEPAT